MCATAFLPFLGEQSGFGLLNRGFFTATFYRGNDLTRVYFGSPATVLTGIWPFVLGLLLVAAGGLYLFRRRRIAGWAAIVIGSLAAVTATLDLMMIFARLGADASRGYAGISPGYGLWVLLGAGLASVAVGIIVVAKFGPRSPDLCEQS